MSNTFDNETKSNLEKEIVDKLLDPIQSKYNELIKKKQDDERKALEELAKKGEEDSGLPETPESQTLPPVPGDETDVDSAMDIGSESETDIGADTWTETGTDIGTEFGTEEKTDSEKRTELDSDEEDEGDDIWRDVEGEAATKIQKAWREKKKSEPIISTDEEMKETQSADELDLPVDLPEKLKPDTSKLDATLQTLLKKGEEEQKKLDSTIQENKNVNALASILPLLAQKQNLQKDIADEETQRQKIEKVAKKMEKEMGAKIEKIDSKINENQNVDKLVSILSLLAQQQNLQKEIAGEDKERTQMEKQTKKGQQTLEKAIQSIDSQINEKINVQSLVPILQLLAQKQKLEQDIRSEESRIKQMKKQTKKGQQTLEKNIQYIDSQMNEKSNVKSLLSILPLLTQKQKLEKDIQAETKQIEALAKQQESKHKKLEQRIAQIEKEEEQQKVIQQLLPILSLLVEQQKLHNELHPKKGLAEMGKDLQNMFSNAKGMLPSVPKMPNMCDVDVSGSASKALSGLTSYLSGIYQDLFEPYNEELAVHRPPEELGNLDKEERDKFKYLGKFTMDMEIGEQPFKQVAHVYYNFKDNLFHTEMELEDILALDKEMEKQLGFDPSQYPNGALAVIGENPEILARAIGKDDPAYQQKLQQIKQTLQQGTVNPMSMPMAVATPIDEKGTIAV